MNRLKALQSFIFIGVIVLLVVNFSYLTSAIGIVVNLTNPINNSVAYNNNVSFIWNLTNYNSIFINTSLAIWNSTGLYDQYYIDNNIQCIQDNATNPTTCNNTKGSHNLLLTSATGYYTDNFTDNNWDTWGWIIKTSGNGEGYLYLNYTKPQNATGALWQIKNDQGTARIANYTIPLSCLNYSENLSLIIRITHYNTGQQYIRAYCKNVSTDIEIYNNANGGLNVYEEEIIWKTESNAIKNNFLLNYTVNNLPVGRYTWNIINNYYYGYFESLIANTSLTNYSFLIDVAEYMPIVYETQLNNWNYIINSEVQTSSAKLVYNNTNHTAVVTQIDYNSYNLTVDFDTPLVSSVVDNTAYWEIVYFNGTKINSSIFTQRVVPITLTLCNATYPNSYINFSFANATTPYNNISASLSISFNYWHANGSGNIKKNYSIQNITPQQNYGFCVNPSNISIYSDAVAVANSLGFRQNSYYLVRQLLSNITTHKRIYLLQTDLGTITNLIIAGQSNNRLPNHYIYAYIYDVGTATDILYSVLKSDYNGQDVGYFNWYDSIYSFIVKDSNGTTVKQTDRTKISDTPITITIIDSSVEQMAKFDNLIYSLTNTSDAFYLTYSDPNNQITAGCLRVIQVTNMNSTILYDHCINSTTGSINYSINTGVNGTYYGIFYARGSLSGIIASVKIYIEDYINNIYSQIGNLNGSVLALMIVGTAAFLGLFSGAAAVLFTIIGFIAAISLGFVGSDPTFIISFITFAAVGGAIIWYVKY